MVPHIFTAAPDAEAHSRSHEVERILWVTLEALATTGTHDSIEIEFPGGRRRFPGYRFGDDVVWGLTYRILTDFLERLR